MTEVGEHFCTGCGQAHGGEQRTDPAVEIARINAKRDVDIARMEYRETQDGAELEAKTVVALTEMETAAAVAVADITDAPDAEAGELGELGEAGPAGDGQAEGADPAEGFPVVAAADPAEVTAAPPDVPVTREKKKAGYWDNYQ